MQMCDKPFQQKKDLNMIGKLNRMVVHFFWITSWKFNIAPEKKWLEDYFPIGKVTFQGLC